MADLTRTVSIIFQGDDNASPVASRLADSIDRVGRETAEAQEAGEKWANSSIRTQLEQEKLAKAAEESANQTERLGNETADLDKAGQSVYNLQNAFKALATSLVVKDFIDANVAAEQFRKQIEFSTGSAAAAAIEFEYVREVSNRLGVEARATAESYATFSSAVKGTALEGEGARVIFEGFAGTLSQTGASSADIAGAFTQLAQGISKGKFELEDLKSIAERVPGFFNAFSDALGITTEALFAQISAGQISGEEILTLANSFNVALQDANFDGWTQSLARLRNAVDDAYIRLGDAGAFDVLIKGLQIGTAAVTGAISGFTLLGEIIGAYYAKIALGSSFDFGAAVAESLDKAANATRGAQEALLGVESTTANIGFNAVEAGARIAEGMSEAEQGASAAEVAAANLDKSLKELGLDPKKFKEPLADIQQAFEDLASNPAVRGDQILAGLKAALKSSETLEDINKIGGALTTAFVNGRLSADEFSKAAVLLGEKQEKLQTAMDKASGASKAQAEALKRQADETKRAEENAAKMALELEKLASNERIKNIEAVVSIKTAQLEADTKRVIASFESIDNVVNNTGELLGELFGLLANYDDLSFSAIRLIEEQIEAENELRKQALDLQKALIEAQIDQIRAQTRNLEAGDPIIKIDGAGLQPHLEAFMFEILRTLQVRVNQDGLSMLLGV